MVYNVEILVRTLSSGQTNGLLHRFSDNLSSFEEPCIILLENLKIDNVMLVIKNPWIRGIISKQGGFTSHGASLLREVGIPCVSIINHEDLSHLLGLQIILDADNSKIYS